MGDSHGTIETVTGPIGHDGFTTALAHEHLFVDFLGPAHPDYRGVDWDDVRSVCLERLTEVRAAEVDLIVDCTCIGIGRNVRLFRDVSSSSGIPIVCATGIYKSLRPPELRDATADELADLFVRELTVGVDDTDARAGFIKLATTDTGPAQDETIVHRAGAIAAVATGAAIVLHSPQASAAEVVLGTLEHEGFDPARLVWAHAQESTLAENLELAARGVTVSLDAIGTSDDEEMLDRIERLAEAGWGDRVVVSSDSSLVVHPAELEYERDIGYVHRTFLPKVGPRFGTDLRDRLTRANVLRAYGSTQTEPVPGTQQTAGTT
jgi:predicted metal-dependent phosphotriesterase family hydrolase